MTELLSELEVRFVLIERCKTLGGQTAFAARHSLSLVYVNDIVRGQRSPGPKVLKALGFERVTRYVRRGA